MKTTKTGLQRPKHRAPYSYPKDLLKALASAVQPAKQPRHRQAGEAA